MIQPDPQAPSLALLQTRPALVKKVLQSIYQGSCCRVLGPRYRYKTDVLREVGRQLGENSFHHAIYLKVSEVEATSEAAFFQSVWDRIVGSFAPGSRVEDGLPDDALGKALDFQHALVQLLTHSHRNLILIVDDLEMIPPNLGALLLGVLRTVFLQCPNGGGARFQAIVGGNLSLSQVALENASGFESVSDLVLVGDLDSIEREALAYALCQEEGVTPEHEAIDYLLTQTQGDPFLIEEVLAEACRQARSGHEPRLEQALVEQAVSTLLGREPYRVLLTELRHIESDPNLLASCLRMLEQETVPRNELPGDIERSPPAVELCAAFECVDNGYRIKPGIWHKILRAHFQPLLVGERYVIMGDWSRAIHYLGHAAADSGYKMRAQLHPAVINAIHVSHSVEEAFSYLLKGLESLYPAHDSIVYRVQGHELRPVGREGPMVSLHDTGHSQVVALDGPEYSMSAVDGQSRLLVPLRVGSRGLRPLGLVSLRPLDNASLHERRDDIKQLTSFLHQAARAIFLRMQLARTDQRAQQLRALNGVLTLMLHHRSDPTPMLLRLALTGVTHGWGLSFNRAVLFEPDARGRFLRGSQAVGHLSRRAAEKEWQAHPYDEHTLEEWLDSLRRTVEEKARHHQPLEEQVARIQVAIQPAIGKQLSRCFLHGRAFLCKRPADIRELPEPVLELLRPLLPYALVPLNTGERTLGVLYVDDKFAPVPLDDDRFELLQAFATQAALVVENVRAIENARRHAENVRTLREQHFTLNTGLIHELRSSMSGVQDLVKEVKMLVEGGEPVDEPLADLAAKARIMDEINNRVQDFNMAPFDPGLHRLQPVVERALSSVSSEQPKHIQVKYLPGKEDPPIRMDRAWIELLLRNLLQNAFEAIADGQDGIVRVETKVAPDTVSVCVGDNGPGVAEEVGEHIFESGVSTKERKDFLRGMGLFYCRQVAQEHQGSLELESTPGKGAMFTLRLPRHGKGVSKS